MPGIAVIYQEFNLVPSLTVAENIFLGIEKTVLGFVRRSEERERVRELLDRIGVDIDPEARCADLTVAQQQAVEIAKALAQDARILVMDEPSATLTHQEVDRLLEIIGDLKSQGIGVIYISHRLEEIFRIADRITVLRDGEHVGTRQTDEVTRESLIELMVGRELESEFPGRDVEIGEPRLAVRGMRRGDSVRDVSLEVRRGEVLGLTGLVGSGRTELARLIFGADQRDAGEILLDGRPLNIRSPGDAIRAGICLLTEDRKSQGLVLGLSVRENFGLPNMGRLSRVGFVAQGRERSAFSNYVDRMRIKLPHHEQAAKNLSGGNQQKVVLAKWLYRDTEVVIFDEPTRGIDVGAKFEIYQLINGLAEEGKAVLMISSELPEILGMSDRILVMHEGEIKGELTEVEGLTQEDVLGVAV